MFLPKKSLKKGIIRFPILAIHYLTSSLGSNCQWRGHHTYGNIANSTLNRFGGQFSENDGGDIIFFLQGVVRFCVFFFVRGVGFVRAENGRVWGQKMIIGY